MTEFTQKQRAALSEKKEAMPDGSFPIRNVKDLKVDLKIQKLLKLGSRKEPKNSMLLINYLLIGLNILTRRIVCLVTQKITSNTMAFLE